MNTYSFFKSLAFNFDPERVHDFALSSFSKASWISHLFPSFQADAKYNISSNNLNWNFPIGLAAGLDKNGVAFDFFSRLGFGAVEIGTVTPIEQCGNPLPRMWRLKSEKSLRNAMGFPNQGMEAIDHNIRKRVLSSSALGINIGKNKWTEGSDILNDYSQLLEWSDKLGDYLVVNISSPNTPGLRDLQGESFIKDLADVIKTLKITKPVFIKLSPDMEAKGLTSLTESIIDSQFAGIVATNTTRIPSYGDGGVSGELLKTKASEVRKKILDISKSVQNFDLIGVGGVSSYDDVLRFWKDGGKFLQIYTSFIYKGPEVLVSIQKGIDRSMLEYKVNNLEELIHALQE